MSSDLAGSGSPRGYALAYEEAKRALDEQERVVTELRSRAGVLIGAAAITTSFFGGRALTGETVSPASWIAIGCFGITWGCPSLPCSGPAGTGDSR